ncbi:nitrate- and nitrite sensing domain-containing protein [Plantactinospora solaniradicis]|uniref:histidine kinase n=1 Tax=Plantactinospora solaniradicis TaxID=1723736 RepID=A0ABW1KAS7_9ACTN
MPSRSATRRGINLRLKIISLLVALGALWAFAAWVTGREGLNLLFVQSVDSQIITPSEPLLLQLQQERRQTLVYLGRPSNEAREQMAAERQKTDTFAATFRKSSGSWQAAVATSGEGEQRLSKVFADLDALTETRERVDAEAITRADAAAPFTSAVESLNRMYDVVGSLDDKEIAQDTAALIQLYRVRELMSQEDALLAGVAAAGKITGPEHAEFVRLVGAQQFLARDTASQLRAQDREKMDSVFASGAFDDWRAAEQRVIEGTRSGRPPVSSQAWASVAGPALTELQEMVLSSGRAVVDRAIPVAGWVMFRFVLLVVLGAAAVIASIVVSITTARSLVAQLGRLRNAAHDLADERLPGVVARLGHGEKVDITAEAPPLDFGDDEIGQVGHAFNQVQETAIRTAVEQAELRRNVRDVFLSLARRTQALVHRQVGMLTELQQGELPPKQLEGLYTVDHLATRMRRNAENLIVLSGSTPGRAWRRNQPMVDVIRAASQEVEDYTRVTVQPPGNVALAGRAVGDVVHLLAELIENALSYSPPHTNAEIKGQMVANGYVIEIEDRGLGMTEEELRAANEQIATDQEFNLANASQLGLFVVSKLAHRHGVRVRLKESMYGGTTAVVLLPQNLVAEIAGEDETASGGLSARAPSSNGPTAAIPSQAGAARPVALAKPTQTAADAPETLPLTPQEEPRYQAWRDLRIEPEPDLPVNTDQTPAGPTAQTQPAQTPSGLPVRVRQASLAAPLRGQSRTSAADTADGDGRAPRPPEQIRRMMHSYQSGTRRGRTDATLLPDEDNDVPSPTVVESPPGNHPPA